MPYGRSFADLRDQHAQRRAQASHGGALRALREHAKNKRASMRGPLAHASIESPRPCGRRLRSGELSQTAGGRVSPDKESWASTGHNQRKGWVEQMRHLRIVGLSLATLAVSAVISASASAALPEWGQCVKLAKGKYTNAACTGEKAKNGGYEWHRGAAAIEKKGFTSSGGAAELRTTEGIATDCTSETTKGELSGSKEVGDMRSHVPGL